MDTSTDSAAMPSPYAFQHQHRARLMKRPGELRGLAFDIGSVLECDVLVLDVTGQVHVDGAQRSRIFIGPCEGSVFIRDCSDCIFTVACRQFRMRDCHGCQVHLFSATRPIIETSHHITFAPFNGAYSCLDKHFREARLDPADNHWRDVHDFNQHGSQLPEPHWQVMDFDSLFDADGSVSAGGRAALSAVFNRFDMDRDGAWCLEEFNAYQLACGDADEVLPDPTTYKSMFHSVHIELDDANALHFFGFVQLCEQLGPVELVSNLRKLAMTSADSDWVVPLVSSTGTSLGPPVNPVPRDSAPTSVSDGGAGSVVHPGPTTGDLGADGVHPVYTSLSNNMVADLERVFRHFDTTQDGAWTFMEFNAFQCACNEPDEVVDSAAMFVQVFTGADIDLTDDDTLPLKGFLQLHNMLGIDEVTKVRAMLHNVLSTPEPEADGGNDGSGGGGDGGDGGDDDASDGGEVEEDIHTFGLDIPGPIQDLAAAAVDRGIDLRPWFAHYDTAGEGCMPARDFERALTGLALGVGVGLDAELKDHLSEALNPDTLGSLLTALDPAGSGIVDYQLLLQELGVEDADEGEASHAAYASAGVAAPSDPGAGAGAGAAAGDGGAETEAAPARSRPAPVNTQPGAGQAPHRPSQDQPHPSPRKAHTRPPAPAARGSGGGGGGNSGAAGRPAPTRAPHRKPATVQELAAELKEHMRKAELYNKLRTHLGLGTVAAGDAGAPRQRRRAWADSEPGASGEERAAGGAGAANATSTVHSHDFWEGLQLIGMKISPSMAAALLVQAGGMAHRDPDAAPDASPRSAVGATILSSTLRKHLMHLRYTRPGGKEPVSQGAWVAKKRAAKAETHRKHIVALQTLLAGENANLPDDAITGLLTEFEILPDKVVAEEAAVATADHLTSHNGKAEVNSAALALQRDDPKLDWPTARKKALVEVRQSHTAKTRQSIISTPDVSEKLFREFLAQLRSQEFRGSFEDWLARRSKQRADKRKELRRWRQSKEAEARRQRAAEERLAPLKQLEEQIETIFNGRAPEAATKSGSVNAALSKLRVSAEREAWRAMQREPQGARKGAGTGASGPTAAGGDSSDGEVDYDALLNGDGDGDADADGKGTEDTRGRPEREGSFMDPPRPTPLVSRRVFNQVLHDVLNTLASDKQVGLAAQRMLDPAAARKRELAAYLRTKAGKRELREHVKAVKQAADDEGVTLTQRQLTARAKRLLKKSLADRAKQEGRQAPFLPPERAMEKATEVGGKAKVESEEAFALWLKAKEKARRAEAREQRAARKEKKREEREKRKKTDAAFEAWKRRAGKRKYFSQREGKVVRKPRVVKPAGRPGWVDVVEPYAVAAAAEGKKARRRKRRGSAVSGVTAGVGSTTPASSVRSRSRR